MRCLSIDIGGTKIASALVENNQLTQRMQVTTPQDENGAGLYQQLGVLINAYQGQFDVISVASTGIINNGVLTALNPKNLGGLAEFPLKECLSTYSDKPIFLLNDVQAAVCAEYQYEDQQAVKNFVFITISTGVGGGIIQNGRLLCEPHGIAGHIGHTLADPNGAFCGCGRRGCVEAIASGRAIEAATANWQQPRTPKEVFELFRQQEPQAVEIVEKSAKTIANLVADLVIGLDTQKVVLGGSIGLAEGYLPLVQSYLAQLPAIYHCELAKARYGADAGLVGAAQWAKMNLIKQG